MTNSHAGNEPTNGVVTSAMNGIADPVALRIDTFLVEEIKRWTQLDPALGEPLGSLRSLVAMGGKRLRPAFCYWAFVGAGGDRHDPLVIDTGAALELLHSFALIHDDVMDDSPRRRGADAVHVEFTQRHRERRWLGEHRRFGEGVAILVGDMAFVYADQLMSKAPRAALDVFTEMRIELNVGQYLDLSATTRSDVSLDMARKIALFKSGKYTVERPLHLGAALAGRFEELAGPLSEYGIPVGEAFQLRDDILGAFGDQDLLGKPVGGDLREGKPTALLAVAREAANGADAKLLDERYGAADIDDTEIVAMQEVLVKTGARAHVEDEIERLVQSGIAAVEDCNIETEARDRLVELAHFVAGREH